MSALLRKLTVEQWEAIDRDYMDRALPDAKVAWILITIAISLILPRYFGNPEHATAIPGVQAWFDATDHPSLWPRVYWGLFKVLNYFLLPALCIKLVLRGRIRDYGFEVSRKREVWLLYLAMFLVVLPLTYGVSWSDAFLRTYPKYKDAGDSLQQFFVWEGVYGFQFFMLEFFFRGFILFALARYIGSAAIFVAIVPYSMIHFAKPLAETLGSIVSGIVLGTIALRTRSIYGGVLVHCAVAWSMDLFALHRKGDLVDLF
jgi:membrane protease YdiL (CAAX protease family)